MHGSRYRYSLARTDFDFDLRSSLELDFDGPEVASALVGALTDTDQSVIEAAAVSLTELKDPKSGDVVLPHLNDQNEVKLAACNFSTSKEK